MYNYFNFPIAMLQDAFKIINYDERYYKKQLFEDIILICCYRYLKDNNLKINFENIREAGNYFKIELHYSVAQFKERGSELYYKHYGYSAENKIAPVGIQKKILYDFLENDKSEQEVITLLMFLGIKSIIGRKDKVKKTNNLFMFSRMAGFNSSIDDFSELPDYLIKYTKRRQRDKLFIELQANWGLKYYSLHNRGFYVSFNMTNKALTKYAEKRKASNKMKKIKLEQKTAKEEALHEMLVDGLFKD